MAQSSVTDRVQAALERARNLDGGWPYLAGRQTRLEPTAWAILALGDTRAIALVERWRSPDGLLVEPGIGSINYAFNALAALALGARPDGQPSALRIATQLLGQRGERVSQDPRLRQDGSLQAWSWTQGTFSWIEPTAWCLLAVKKLAPNAPAAQERIAEAERVFGDRACKDGGWNVGNSEVYGQSLEPYVPTTALGILALQDHPNDALVQRAVAVLNRDAVREGSTQALALSWLALTAVSAPCDELAGKLPDRLPFAESIGNIASLAMMLYVLRHQERGSRPSDLLL